MSRFTKKQIYKDCIIIFICLLIISNLVHLQVLCFGADGHIEVESAFHDCCDNSDHCSSQVPIVLSTEAGSEICKHCGPCIDIPISKDLVQISKTPQKINPIFLIQATNIFTDIDELNCSRCNFARNILFDTSYFDPLRTVILLV